MTEALQAPAAPSAPVIQSLAATPDLLALHAADPQRFFCLLNSGAHAERTGRYDILFAEPRCIGSAAVGTPEAEALLAALDADPLEAAPGRSSELPFVGGCVFHLGYEAAACFEPKLRLPRPADEALPDITVWSVDQAILVDVIAGKAWCVAPDQASAAALAREAGRPRKAVRPYAKGLASSSAESPQRYRDGVAAVRDYLFAGDAFQVNLSRGWRLRLAEAASGASLHAAMRLQNAAPFSALLHQDGASLVSASPERLVRVVDGVIETRPIAGTRRRGRDAQEDVALCGELSRNPKERAEHVMLIDLERNDLGRICRAGSVRVDELLAIEHYASVHHLVSNIRGALRADVGAAGILRAVFPGGTITGCPKVRVMEIIAELEGIGRGSYTGSLGYVSRNGRMDSSILIRSLLARGDDVRFRAGAGIVADSDPDAELAETEAKARGLLSGLGA